jgi:cell division protein FtsQ
MTREFTGYEDDFEDDAPPTRRRQQGVRVTLRGGLPRSRGGKIAAAAAVLVLVGLCGAAAMLASNAILHDARFMISSATAIETEGNQHVARAQIVSLFGEDIERNIFRVPLKDRKTELEELPWVEHATVMRLLPNRLRVSVSERTPVAFVRQGNRIGLVDANGVLLDMSSEMRTKTHYSFPIVTGLEAKDPLSLRAARMKLYSRFTADLDGSGEKITEKLSEVDLSNPEDVRVVIPDKAGEVMVHFGEENFLDRYKKFEEHLPEWRTQYPHLASVDMRYERQVVLEMQPGTAAPIVGEQQAPNPGDRKPAPAPASTAKTASAPTSHAVAGAKKTSVKTTKKAAPKKAVPVKHKSAAHKAGPTASIGEKNETLGIRTQETQKTLVAFAEPGPGPGLEWKSFSPQVVHP